VKHSIKAIKTESVKEEQTGADNELSSFCFLKALQDNHTSSTTNNSFWTKGWRESLCSCNNCITLYDKEKVSYLVSELTELEDEEENLEQTDEANNRPIDLLETGQNAFLHLPIPHQNKVDLIVGYTHMRDGLKEYLRDFAESGREVTKEDITSFFETMQDPKRRKKE